MTRQQIITTLLTRYHELTEGNTGGHADKADSRTLTLPHEPGCHWTTTGRPCNCAVRVLQELTRLLTWMRDMPLQERHLIHINGLKISPAAARWHILHYYVNVERKPRQVRQTKTIAGKRVYAILTDEYGSPRLEFGDDGGYKRHPNANRLKAEAGIQWLAEAWNKPWEPYLPRDILKLTG